MRTRFFYPDDYVTTADYAIVGDPIDTTDAELVAFTIVDISTAAQAQYEILGAMEKDFIDAQVVQAGAVIGIKGSGTEVGGYWGAAVWKYYGLFVRLVGGPTTVRVRGVTKG